MLKVLNNLYIVTMEEDEIINQGHIIIEDDKIKEVNNGLYEGDIANITNYNGEIILPSFVNTHVHTMQQMGRGIADDVNLITWLNDRIWPYESGLSKKEAYLSAKACMMELLKTGVTTFLEAGGEHVSEMAKAANELNMNAILTYNVLNEGDVLPKSWVKSTEELIRIQKEFIDNLTSENISIALGLRTIFNCDESIYEATKKLQDETGSLLTTHVLEVFEERDFTLDKYKMSTVKVLEKHGLLNDKLIAAHCVHLDESDIKLFNENGVRVSYNPAAAMKVTLGFAPLMKYNFEQLTIGTDGAPSNNRMDIMRDIYLAALLTKGNTLDPTALTSMDVLKMATINGAKALHMDHKVGSIKTGKEANFTIFKMNDIHTTPIYYNLNNLVYSASSNNISEVYLKGECIIRDGEFIHINEHEVLEEVKHASIDIAKRLNI